MLTCVWLSPSKPSIEAWKNDSAGTYSFTSSGQSWILVDALKMSAVIRLMTEEDIPGYRECLDLVAKEARFLAMTQAPSLERSLAWVTPHLKKHAAFFVAVHEGQIVGWCDISPMSGLWFTHRGTLGMGVLPAYRGQAIGRAMLSAAIEHAVGTGIERIEAEVFASNLSALILYERFGFTLEGRLRKARKTAAGYEDLILMALIPSLPK